MRLRLLKRLKDFGKRSPRTQAALRSLVPPRRMRSLADALVAYAYPPAQADGVTLPLKRTERIFDHLLEHLSELGVAPGKALEVGGRANPYREALTELGWEYHALDLDAQGKPWVRQADITHCPEIADGEYDLVFSVDVFEHINRPWLAASEITRILRPGAVAYTSTLFSWRYHPCPIDYWRYSPACLSFLFSNLETVAADFDTTERRRDIRGAGRANPLLPDELGGWRENWRVFHVGRKPAG